MLHQACDNPTCAQYRMQHKNMTLKNLQLQKDVEDLRRLQDNQFHVARAQSAAAQIRDRTTGDLGLLVNGEVMTPDKVAKKMEIASKCTATLSTMERINRELTDENRGLKVALEKIHGEAKRLKEILSGFERPRRYETFTDPMHAQTLRLNEELSDEIEQLERKVRLLQEENQLLKRRLTHHKTKRDNEQKSSNNAMQTEEAEDAPIKRKIPKKKRPSLDDDDQSA